MLCLLAQISAYLRMLGWPEPFLHGQDLEIFNLEIAFDLEVVLPCIAGNSC